MICKRDWLEASCQLLAATAWHQFVLHWDTSLGAMVGQILQVSWVTYVEVWCVPSATHMSCILCKIQTEVLGIRGLVTLFSISFIYVCTYVFIYLYMNMSANSESNLVRLPICTIVIVFLNLILFCNLLYWYFWTWILLRIGPLFETIILSKCTWTLSCLDFSVANH